MKTTNALAVHEELVKYGVKAQTNAELLSIIIGNADKAEKLLAGYESIESGLARQDYENFINESLTKKEAQRLIAAIELGKRIAEGNNDTCRITSPGAAATYLMPKMRHETHEKFVVLLLNTKNRITKLQQISEGSLTSAVVHPREVFAPAVTNHAAAILVAHNHPSGDPYPSQQDKQLTESLNKAGEILGIPLLDHVVIGDGCYYSFKEHGDF